MATVPRTIARLQPYIKIFDGRNNTFIAAVQELSLKIDRPTDLWRELNTERQGRPVEIYPKLPTYTGTLSRIVLYDANSATILKAFQYGSGYDITDQDSPLTIQIQMSAPDAANQKTLSLQNVWLENAPLDFNIASGDLRIVQAVSFQFTGVTVS